MEALHKYCPKLKLIYFYGYIEARVFWVINALSNILFFIYRVAKRESKVGKKVEK